MQYLFPPNHLLAVLLQDFQNPLIKVCLQSVIVLDTLLLHKGLNLRIAVPLFAFIFVTTDMDVSIRKECGHLTQERVEKFVCLLAGWIERRFKDSRAAFNLVGTRRAAEFRISHQPTCAVSGDIKLGHHANSAFAGVSDDLAYLLLRVIKAVRSQCMKFGKFLAFNPEALVLAQMPVKDI